MRESTPFSGARLSTLSLDERTRLEERWLGKSRPTPSAPPSVAETLLPLSFGQESLWYFDQLAPDSPLYHIPEAFLLRGRLDPRALENSLAALVERHEALRTRFVVVNGS